MSIEDLKKDISVVIQGPLDDRTYEAIDCYQDFSEVIISTWSEKENYELLYKKRPNSVFKLVTSHYPSEEELQKVWNQGYVMFMTQTLHAGAKASKSKYVLKIRSDELYPNLDKLLENLIQYPDRIHTTNNGFWKTHPYHRYEVPFSLSNHLILAKKEVIEAGTKLIMEFCLGINFQDLPREIRTPEQLYGIFLLAAQTGRMEGGNWKQIFKDNVFITPCSELPGHLHSGQSSSSNEKAAFKRSSEPYPCGRSEMANGCHDAECLYHHIDEITI